MAESGNLQSEIYELEDCIIYDDCVTGNASDYWATSSNVTATRGTSGTTFANSSTGTGDVFLTVSSSRLLIPCTNNFCIDFDVTNANTMAFYFPTADNSRGSLYISSSFTSTDTVNIKLQYKVAEKKMYFLKDDVAYADKAIDFETNTATGFIITDWQGDLNLTIKNFKVYPI